ncbi:MAG: heavy metal translocating P-type ATPase [Candidatus Curtissbacteria bacterium]
MKKVYTCPMHPEVTSDKPGNCPKCGMNLEAGKKEEASKNHSHEGMEENFKRRFLIALPLTLLVLLLSPSVQKWLGFSFNVPNVQIILFALTSIIVFYNGWPFYQMAEGELKSKKPAMMTLVSMAVILGYLFSIAATFLFEGEYLYWEISTLVLVFLFGHYLEMRAVRGATGALGELAKLIPPSANLVTGNTIKKVKTESLKVGDIILVRPGEKVPIDGEVIKGESSISESMITGESAPVAKIPGSSVIGGTINSDGSLRILVTKVGSQTAISQMMELIVQAQQSKPQVQLLADRAAAYLTYIAIIAALASFTFWFFINPHGAIFAVTLAISTIVIACPHALGLAIPTVTIITTALAARNGILIQDMKALEIARKLNWVVFDKTGTLTTGKFGVTQIFTSNKAGEKEIIQLASSVEYHSQHSLAQAILERAKQGKIKFSPAVKFRSIPGKGAMGYVGKAEVMIGNPSLMSENKIQLDSPKIRKTGTMIYVAKDKKLMGAILLEDTIRPQSKEAIKTLKDLGIKTAMLTGDNQNVADSVAAKLGLDTVFANVLPSDKVNKIKELQAGGSIVAMVGDGINDAPSLTQANVGIAIGTGTGVAIESAEIILVKDNPMDVVKAINLSKKTGSKMLQNLAWAAGYNVVTIPVAAGALFPFGILLKPEWSALLMSASSIIVVVNALSLKRTKL